MSVWRWPSARWGVTVLTVHQGERADRATQVHGPGHVRDRLHP